MIFLFPVNFNNCSIFNFPITTPYSPQQSNDNYSPIRMKGIKAENKSNYLVHSLMILGMCLSLYSPSHAHSYEVVLKQRIIHKLDEAYIIPVGDTGDFLKIR